ncbi:MAG: glycosyltransferase [Defluviitaleaceae bacterium]|nr:glycosyltransferase [Defluviitaleaceae bacterium]
MERVLIVLPNLDQGGTEMAVMNYFRVSGLPFDFAVHGAAGYYEAEAESLGARIFRVPTRSQGLWKNIRAMRDLYRKRDSYGKHIYKTVIVCTEHSFAFIELLTAKMCGVRVRAAWSHFSDYQGASRLKRRLHFITRPLMRLFGNLFLACTKDAGKWLFGRSVLRDRRFHVINNAIDLDRFKYNPAVRAAMRDKLGLGGKFAVGIVGRLAPVKNHAFALEVFAQISEKDDTAAFVIIGVGELEDEITANAARLGITDKTRFIGMAGDLPGYYQAMDALIVPSLHEGFGIVALEGQAAGLPTLLSEGVPLAAAVCNLARHMNLSEGTEAWADVILTMKGIERKEIDLTASGFHITEAASKFRKIILEAGQ